MSQITLQLLAKELGLSIATVSKALRDSHEISAATKQKVLERAKALNYTPNPYASSLRRKRSNTIAVVIPEVADSFFSLAIRGIEEVAQSKGYHVLIYLTYERYEKEIKILEDCRNGRVDGVLMSVAGETTSFHHIQQLTSDGIPVVFFDRAPENMRLSKVVTDDFEIAYKATIHLVECGCNNIVYLSVSHHLYMNQQRINGFTKALQDKGLYKDNNRIINCTNDTETNKKIIHRLLNKKSHTDGMLVSVEKLVIPIYLLCKELQIRIPEQVRIISFSTTEYAGVLTPALSTVLQPATEIGKRAAAILFSELKGKNAAVARENIVIPSGLQIRGSTTMERP